MMRRTSHRGHRSVRSAQRRPGRAIGIEGLEQRWLLTINNPLIVPVAALPIEGTAFGTNSPLIATFASPAAVGNLSATVIFPSGTTTATIASSGATETVDGVNVPEFQVNYTGNWTPPDESPGVPFTVTITDSTAGTGNTTALHGATAVRDAVLSTIGGVQSIAVTEGETVNFSDPNFLMEFTDGNPNSSPSDFTATIDWGDGSPNSAGVVAKTGPNVFTVSGPHTYGDKAGPITVLVTDKGGSSTSHTSAVTILDAPLSEGLGTSFTGTEGQTISNVLVGTFKDGNPFGDPSDFAAKINWGDASADAGAVSLIGGNSTGAIFGIYGNHTYTEDSIVPFNVTVNVTDKGGSSLPTINSTATIADPLLIMAGGYKVSAVEGTSTGAQKVATFIDPGGNEPPANYTANISWGDGAKTPGTITFASGFFSVSGPHTYTKAGSYQITTTITHVPGIPQSVTSSATITKAPLKASSTMFSGFEGRSTIVKVANFTASSSTTAASFAASIDWGDGKTTAGTIVKDATGKYHVNGSHAYAEEKSSPYTVKVTIKQSGGSTVSVNSKADIDDSPLDQAVGVSTTATKNSSFSSKKLGTFRDQDALNKLGTDYEGTIDWGDGTKSAPGFVFTSATPNVGSFWKITGSHKYLATGTFTVKITIDDTGSPGKKISFTSTIKVT